MDGVWQLMASPSDPLHAQFPSAPIVDAAGNLSSAWRGFFLQLYARTGGPGPSASLSGLAADDVALGNAIAAEQSAREHADTVEQDAREAADNAEAVARATADNARLLLSGGSLTGPVRGPTAVFDAFVSSVYPGGPTWTSGLGAPAVAQPVGSIYSRRDGALGATLYVRGTSGWSAVAGV